MPGMTALLTRARRAGIALLACAVLAPGVAGCGSNDEQPAGGGASKPAGKAKSTPTPKPGGGGSSGY
jgi:hypothetical protein